MLMDFDRLSLTSIEVTFDKLSVTWHSERTSKKEAELRVLVSTIIQYRRKNKKGPPS
jgi:hypothetical protein